MEVPLIYSRTAITLLTFLITACGSGSGGGGSSVSGIYCGGNGTQVSPYLICDEDSLLNIHVHPSKHYKLSSDISLTDKWISIDEFSGVLDGNGMTIINLKPSIKDFKNSRGGLIDYNSGTILNLKVRIASAQPATYSYGGVVGRNNADGVLDKLTISGSISNSNNQIMGIGGLVGLNNGTIKNIHSDVSISSIAGAIGSIVGTGDGQISDIFVSESVTMIQLASEYGTQDNVGGVIGYNAGKMTNITSKATVKSYFCSVGGIAGSNSSNITTTLFTGNASSIGTSFISSGGVGGIVGAHSKGVIESATSLGQVSSSSAPNVGGIVGQLWEGSIFYSRSSGTVSGKTDVGGITGYNWSATISNSFSTANVVSQNKAGGIVGYLVDGKSALSTGWMTNTYFVGSLTGTTKGGLVAYGDTIPAVSSFWDTEVSGVPTSITGTGKTTNQMKNAGTYAGWNFVNIWTMSPTTGYPELR